MTTDHQRSTRPVANFVTRPKQRRIKAETHCVMDSITAGGDSGILDRRSRPRDIRSVRRVVTTGQARTLEPVRCQAHTYQVCFESYFKCCTNNTCLTLFVYDETSEEIKSESKLSHCLNANTLTQSKLLVTDVLVQYEGSLWTAANQRRCERHSYDDK